jgi:hypothetical protein
VDRVYLVIADPTPVNPTMTAASTETVVHPKALLAFADRALADQHASELVATTGAPYSVHEVPLAAALPIPTRWHHLVVEVTLGGSELWRHERIHISWTGHPDEVTDPCVRWWFCQRETPSQPPSRVHIDVIGVDRDFCVASARQAFAEAHRSPAFARVVAIEDMFASSRFR